MPMPQAFPGAWRARQGPCDGCLEEDDDSFCKAAYGEAYRKTPSAQKAAAEAAAMAAKTATEGNQQAATPIFEKGKGKGDGSLGYFPTPGGFQGGKYMGGKGTDAVGV